MNLQERKEILVRLGDFIKNGDEEWETVKQRANAENAWFTPEFMNLAATTITRQFLAEDTLQTLIETYAIPYENTAPKKVGLVMAGNIPMVGFHDLLCTFLTGHKAVIKLSSKDTALMTFLIRKIIAWSPEAESYLTIAERLNNCDAYIATGSNNTSNYFEYYFGKHPNIIRKNRTSVAIISGEETEMELERLADDVFQYFGLGCRNVTKIYFPKDYNFEPLLAVFKKYNYLADHAKYKNNYDYNLAIHLLNKTYFMSSESVLMIEASSPFSAISQLHFEYYDDAERVRADLKDNNSIQCIVSKDDIPFGQAQCPGITDFADGVDTVQFLVNLADQKEVRRS